MSRPARFRFSLCLLTILSLTSGAIRSGAAPVTLIDDPFNNLTNWTDLSRAVTWNNYSVPTSAFSTSGGEASMTGPALANSGYIQSTDLKTFTCLDFQFPQILSHEDTVLTCTFRARWPFLLNGTSKGELNRFMVTINFAYPPAGLDTRLNVRYNDISAHWWARPAYHLRIRGANDSDPDPDLFGSTLLEYGGGINPYGQYEIFGFNGTPWWWLPGFISSADPDGETVSPGLGPGYPVNTWVATDRGLASNSYQTFKYVIKPWAQEVWLDPTGTGSSYVLEGRMPLPPDNLAPGDNPIYRYFPELSGIRLFWRAGGSKGNVRVDHFTATLQAAQELADAWRQDHFPATFSNLSLEGSHWGDYANPDGDSLPNYQERFFGTNPHVYQSPDQLPWQIAMVDGPNPGEKRIEVTYQVAHAAADVGGFIQWSEDLSAWSTSSVWEDVISQNGSVAVVRATLPVEARYVRVVFAGMPSGE